MKQNYNFRYSIPNVFYDAEDGDIKHLKLKLLKTEPALLSWVEFDAEKQILLALYVINKDCFVLCNTIYIFFFNLINFTDHWKNMYQNGK